jgi:DNA-binding response OmpR family regulator
MSRNFRILMADDDQRHCQIYEATLKAELDNVQVEFAKDGAEAWRKAIVRPYPDLIVADVDMPNMTGGELLRKLKLSPALKNIPVIILTGSTAVQGQMDLLEGGAEDFVDKGASPGVFVARIKAQMRHKMALDRLNQMAMDRDVFAAGVLHDIRNIESVIVTLCQRAREKISRDLVGEKDALEELLESLLVHSSKLGKYASEVIKSVRKSGEKANLSPQSIGPMISKAIDHIHKKDPSLPSITWNKVEDLQPVLADESFLKLTIKNLLRFASRNRQPDGSLNLELNQIHKETSSQRQTLITQVRTNCRKFSEEEHERVFKMGDYGVSVEELEMPMIARLIQNMGGHIWSESSEDYGLIINIELPKA